MTDGESHKSLPTIAAASAQQYAIPALQAPDKPYTRADQDSARASRRLLERFRDRGITVAAWSEQRGFNSSLVYAVIKGKRKCLRGQSHQIAVALGLKGHADDANGTT